MRPRLVRGDLRILAVLAAVALAVFLAALAYRLGEILMKRSLALAAIGAAALAMSACSTMQGMAPEDRRAVLKGAAEHIEKCDRDYWANTGLPGSAGFRITCRQPQDPGELAKAIVSALKDAGAGALAAAAATPAPVSPK